MSDDHRRINPFLKGGTKRVVSRYLLVRLWPPLLVPQGRDGAEGGPARGLLPTLPF